MVRFWIELRLVLRLVFRLILVSILAHKGDNHCAFDQRVTDIGAYYTKYKAAGFPVWVHQ